ncbi:M28 family peptidase [Hymenobacter sp. BT18]|uniref:M28 family peptidase n=1 Tax=Hymenobacter sp. BT18 TaxID=2835648 RepID=UPI00143EB95A|nr:M28 family peptidase [Hymenobacter sp. BT18]QIX59962.1 M28 family peptidase [Hymenobacter sp. BT18]
MLRKLFFAAAFALVGANCAMAQDKPTSKIKTKSKPGTTAAAPAAAPATDWSVNYAATITAEDLRQHLSVLASNEYEGRETGQKGQKMAADYISKQFAAFGLSGPVKGGANMHLQQFELERSTWAAGGQTLQMGGKTYTWLQDYYVRGVTPFQTLTTVQPLFVGYGIEQEGYSDYATAGDVKGKDLFMMMGEPLGADGKPVLSPDGKPTRWGQASPGTKLELAARKGARSVFFVDFSPNANFARLAARLASSTNAPIIRFTDAPVRYAPGIYVSPAVGYAILKTKEADVQKYLTAVAAAKKPVASSFKPASIKIKTEKKREMFGTENVLGYLEGSDKKDELLVISAHYDHLGVKNGVVFNGADDDGSGTASVLELAQAFAQAKKEGHGPRRSLLFLANTGEEVGLLGSEYYVNHPIFPLAQTVTNLNIDMLGRVDKDHEGKGDYVYLVGSDKLSSELHALSEATTAKYTPVALDYKYNDPNDPERIYYRSDHYNFAKNKVPVLYYTSGLHDDYHKESDDVDKIDFPAMTRRDQLIFHTAWELANRDSRVVIDSNKP